MKMNDTCAAAAALAAAAFAAVGAAAAGGDPAAEKARAMLAKMTLDEKVSLCAGSGTMSLPKIPRVGIEKEWQFSDNSQTVRADMERWTWNCTFKNDEATVLPTLSALASTWSVEMAERFGHVMGEQARARGKDMMLGPGVNIMRTPLCGRNWEYFSEDPVLTSRLAVPEIKAMQSHDVAACVKHYCLNNQEHDRHRNDAVVDDRTLNEIYLPAFRAAVKEAGVYSLMTSYNMYNGEECSQHTYLIKGILRERWGFDGMIVTDWGGQVSTVPSALSGAGVEMNRGSDIRYLANPKTGAKPLADAVRAGKVPEAFVDEKAFRVLYAMARTHFLDPANRKGGERLTEKHFSEARAIAEEAVTLLKNDDAVLPLDPAKMKKILVVGKLADTDMTRKGWSAAGKPPYEITPYKGLVEFFKGKGVEIVRYPLVPGDSGLKVHPVIESSIGTFDTTAKDAGMSVRAWETEWFKTKAPKNGEAPFKSGFSCQPGIKSGTKSPLPGLSDKEFCIKWRTRLTAPESGEYAFGAVAEKGAQARIFLEGRQIGTGKSKVRAKASLEAGKEYRFEIVYTPGWGGHSFEFGWQLPSERGTAGELRRLASAADAVLVFTGTEIGHGRALDCEGADRPDMRLPVGHDAAIAEILSWKLPNTVVVNHSGSPVEMPWVDSCRTLVQQPYLGQEAGRALANVLFGRVNPSGKLPCTWPRKYSDTPTGTLGGVTPRHSPYKERFYVGYRWYDKKGVKPMFPFGYGIGYTTFGYGKVAVAPDGDGFKVTAKVTNTGKVAGKEAVQVYVSYPGSKVERCVKELKAFAKTRLLAPGESETLEMHVSLRDLAYWDDIGNRFATPAGDYEFQLGASCEDIRSKAVAKVEEAASFRD